MPVSDLPAVVAPSRVEARALGFSISRAEWSLAALALVSCVAVLAASLRHTGSIAFPIDDGYIYSNYVLSAAQGHPFTYNPGQVSGGITGSGWYLVCTLFYVLLAPFHALLGGLGPPLVRSDPPLAAQAVHLYLAAYIPGAICLALTAAGVFRLARLSFHGSETTNGLREALCWLAGAFAAVDLGLVWGALSGLEVPLSAALATWALVLLVQELRAGRLRWSLLLAALLPLARPDLIVVALAALSWLGLRALAAHDRRWAVGAFSAYLFATVGGAALMGAVYWVGWGRPLPSSFYAKVGGIRLGARFFSATDELVAAGRAWPFVGAALVVVSGLLQATSLVRSGADQDHRESAWTSLLLLLVSVLYVGGIMLTLPWFGQEERYLLPIHPFVIVLLVGGLWWLVSLALGRVRLQFRVPAPVALPVAVLLAVGVYLWATENYVVEVRNIADAHIAPARWLAANTPPGTVVASEPIGAVRLFSERPTVDLVGLTTPATLGTYRNWPLAWPALRGAGAQYLLYYPRWFDSARAPSWAQPAQTFAIPDNRIAGDSTITVYHLNWSLFTSGK